MQGAAGTPGAPSKFGILVLRKRACGDRKPLNINQY